VSLLPGREFVDAEMIERIYRRHCPTVTWWGCTVARTCLACGCLYPCPALERLKMLLRMERTVRVNVGRFPR
jgi:hypothetical protein